MLGGRSRGDSQSPPTIDRSWNGSTFLRGRLARTGVKPLPPPDRLMPRPGFGDYPRDFSDGPTVRRDEVVPLARSLDQAGITSGTPLAGPPRRRSPDRSSASLVLDHSNLRLDLGRHPDRVPLLGRYR